MHIQISWILQNPTDLDLHCLQRQGISEFSMTRVKEFQWVPTTYMYYCHKFYHFQQDTHNVHFWDDPEKSENCFSWEIRQNMNFFFYKKKNTYLEVPKYRLYLQWESFHSCSFCTATGGVCHRHTCLFYRHHLQKRIIICKYMHV